MCLFVCTVDHGVNEGEPIDEKYRKQVCEDQYHVGPKPATRGGVNGRRSKFLSKFKPSAYIPKITASPPPGVCENSYRQAISQQHTLENFAEAKLKNSPNSNTAESDRSDR